VKISAVIIAFNEEESIAEAIRSVEFADEILVVDSESTDHTREIASGMGTKVIVQPWLGFGKQKQFATEQAAYDRILSLDSDERVSDELKSEILKIRDSDNAADGYRIPRLTKYMGRDIRHGGWYPDWQLRFFDRRKGRWKDVSVHESVQMDPGAGVERLTSNILHDSVNYAKDHVEMIRTRYAPLGADAMYAKGLRGSLLKQIFSPAASFIRGYILKAGFLDGFPGLSIAYFGAYNVYLKHRLLRDMPNRTR
jgi:glycosyltransferase involved in cell wall biosynthesis